MADDGLRIERNLQIQLSDGVSLVGDVYMPDSGGPFPALLGFTPYRKDDMGGSFSDYGRRWFARHGYACVLVDFRGLGGSEGVAEGAMHPQESKDVAEVVEWVAAQSWCDGGVGMWGVSYEAITSLEAAAQNPPHLKAIVPIQGAFDIYDDWFYPGGCANMLGAPGMWGSFMLGLSLMPPTLQDNEGRWYRIWRERLETNEPMMLSWPAHPDKDEFWRSRILEVEKITVPTYAIGSWWDIFPEAMTAVYGKLSGPKKLLMGPWMHGNPDDSAFEPLDVLRELLRWWDHWLKGEDTGIMDEPPVTIYVQGGGWRHETDWPSPVADDTNLFLGGEGSLVEEAPPTQTTDGYEADPTVGTTSTLWDPMAIGVGKPLDQGPDDLLSLTYTTRPLTEDMEITGSPEAVVYAAIDGAEDVNLVAKLCDIDGDGGSSLVTTGWLKGGHHRSHETPEKLEPGRVYEFHVPMWATSYIIPKGHRLRLSLSCSDFPRIWPTPSNSTVTVHIGNSRVCLPVVKRASDLPAPTILRPETDPERSEGMLASVPTWTIEHDLANDTKTVRVGQHSDTMLKNGGRFKYSHVAVTSTSRSRPDGASLKSESKISFESPLSGLIEMESDTWSSHQAMALNVRITMDGHEMFRKSWHR